MSKNVILTAILFLFLFNFSDLYSQTSKNTLDGSIISLKAGYHTGDINPLSVDIPPGFCVDGTLELHTGKNWYIGLNYDLSFGNNTSFGNEQNYTIYNFSPLVKYRFFFKNAAVYIGAGIGSSNVSINGSSSDKMIGANLRTGIDYKIDKKLLASFETVYMGMSEVNMGGGSSNSYVSFKVGLGYLFGVGR